MGLLLKPSIGVQLSPLSVERNSPGGDVPAYQEFFSLACPGEIQKTISTARAFSSFSTFSKAGGDAASVQVDPASLDRNTVGPRCPVFAAITIVCLSLGSGTM